MIYKHNKSGLTLLELLIALGIFGILTLTVSRIYVSVVDVQQRTIDEQSLEGDLSYAMDVLKQEAQAADIQSSNTCGVAACDDFFCIDGGNVLCVENDGVLVNFYLNDDNQLVAERDSTVYAITSDDINITNLAFSAGHSYTHGDIEMGSVLVKISAASAADSDRLIHYQTTITNTEFQ